MIDIFEARGRIRKSSWNSIAKSGAFLLFITGIIWKLGVLLVEFE